MSACFVGAFLIFSGIDFHSVIAVEINEFVYIFVLLSGVCMFVLGLSKCVLPIFGGIIKSCEYVGACEVCIFCIRVFPNQCVFYSPRLCL